MKKLTAEEQEFVKNFEDFYKANEELDRVRTSVAYGHSEPEEFADQQSATILSLKETIKATPKDIDPTSLINQLPKK